MKASAVLLLLCLLSQAASFAASADASWNPGSERLRGANVDQDCSERDLEDLRSLGANQVRWHLSWRYYKEDISKYRDEAAYGAWLDSAIERARRAALVCERLGMKMLVDLASPPGDRVDGSWVSGIFVDHVLAERLAAAWELIARRLKGYKAIYAFEIVNEPVLPEGRSESAWRELFLRTVERIRAVDPGRVVVYDVIPWDNACAFAGLEPLPIGGVIYTLHMYMPEKLTSQYQAGSVPRSYPGEIPLSFYEYMILRGAEGALASDGRVGDYGAFMREQPVRRWDKETLRAVLRPVLDFQRENGAPIYVGEFSCPRWAPGDSAFSYARDCIELFEEYGWDWSYHIWRSSDVWDAEMGTAKADRRRSEAPTDRVLLLKSAYARNERAGF